MHSFPLDELLPLLPLVAVALAGIVALIADVWLGRSKVALGNIAVAGVVAAGLALVLTWNLPAPKIVLGGALVISRVGLALGLAVLVAAGSAALYSMHYGQGTAVASGETYGLLLLSTTGMLGLCAANDLITLFVSFETLSLGVYALTGVARHRAGAAEGAMKYFVLGAFSSGFLLYGIALVYGASGTVRLDEIAVRGFGSAGGLGLTGTLLVLVGFLFKLGAVPFHAWVPDAYEGAPANVTGFMSVAVKAAALGAALRVLIALGLARVATSFQAPLDLEKVLWVVAAATMILGNAGAFTQSNPRRLLAYSGIAHTGYALVGLVAVARFLDARRTGIPDALLESSARDAASGIVYYALGYGVANLAAFAVLSFLESRGQDVDDVDSLAGLSQTRPLAALAMTVAMISLAGIPGTAGFIAKLWVFRAGIGAGDAGLVILGLLASALSLYYYLRIVVVMYMRAPAGEVSVSATHFGARLAYGLCALATIGLGVLPGKFLELATSAGGMF
jgi:NADH-quinone oxidoreductase subunit N